MLRGANSVLRCRTELGNCTFVRTVLMLLVVFYHCILFWGGDWFTSNPTNKAPFLGYLAEWLNTYHIYGFMLVSGYVYYFGRYEKGKYQYFLPFVKNKLKRLLIPYAFVAFVWVIPISGYFSDRRVDEYFVDFFFAVSPSQLWFLWTLFGVFLIAWMLSDFFEKKTIKGGVVCLAFYGVGMLGKIILPNVFQIWGMCQYLFYFWLGFKIRQYGSELLRRIPTVLWIVADIALFAIMCMLSGADSLLLKAAGLGVRFIVTAFGAAMSFVLLQKLAERIDWKKNRLFCFISRYTMPMYLFHQQVIYFSIYWLNGIINPYLHAGVNFIIATLISILISVVLTHFKATRVLIGEK